VANEMCQRVTVSSFNPCALRRLKRLNPRIQVGLLYGSRAPLSVRSRWLRSWVRPEAIHPHHTMVDTKYMTWSKGQGYRVAAWTVDDPAEMRRLIRLDVDLIITGRPELFWHALQAEVGQGPAELMTDADTGSLSRECD
jgi:glycerophosphoryl diester phosphodiesterase